MEAIGQEPVQVAAPDVATAHAGSRVAPSRRLRPAGLPRERWLTLAVFMAAGLVLYVAYLWQARTVAMNSDGGSDALQAWEMLHGNVLLRGWSLSDVSWYTTELPQYMLVELARGLNGDVVHVAAAITYTLTLLLAALVARGGVTGREGAMRALLAAGVMLAPSLGRATNVLLSNADHFGTQIVLLLIWLVLDRARVRRWWIPAAVTVMLAWGQVADAIVLYEGVVPIVLVCGFRMYKRPGPVREKWYELSLAAGAVVSAGLATAALILIRDAGGFAMRTPRAAFTEASALFTHLWVTLETVLELFGADFFGLRLDTPAALVALLHLVGVVLAGWALLLAVRQFSGQDFAVQLITVALIMLLAAYLLGPRGNTLSGAYEIGGVLPLGAVLAGRMLAARLLRSRLLPGLAAVLGCYAALLAGHAAHRPAFSDNQRVAIWLQAHHLHYGLGTWWRANAVTADSGNRVQVRPLAQSRSELVVTHHETVPSWYDPRLHYADFVVAPGRIGACMSRARPCVWAATFGVPAQAYQVGDLMVLVWHKNLLNAHFKHTPPDPSQSIADSGSPVPAASGSLSGPMPDGALPVHVYRDNGSLAQHPARLFDYLPSDGALARLARAHRPQDAAWRQKPGEKAHDDHLPSALHSTFTPPALIDPGPSPDNAASWPGG